jgi:hypothetical protein
MTVSLQNVLYRIYLRAFTVNPNACENVAWQLGSAFFPVGNYVLCG